MKKSISHFSQELAAIARNKKTLISVTAVALIPVLYSFMFLWAFWDPYAKMDVLPVAVVNEDKGTTLNGKELSVGTEFVNKLKDTPSFGWDFVSEEKARDGLKDHTYYMAIVIPEDFSEKAGSVMGDNPQPAIFKYIPNESTNFLAAQIGGTAMEKIKGQLSAQMTKTYTETLFGSFGKLSDGLAQAADGAAKLYDGSKSVDAGVAQIDLNLGKLSEGTQPLKTGVAQLSTGASKLYGGLLQLQTGTNQLNGGLGQLVEGHKALVAGSAKTEQGASQLNAGLAASSTGLDQLKTGAAGLSTSLEQLSKAMPQLAENPNFAKLVEAGKQIATGTETAAAAQKQLSAGAEQLYQGQQALNNGIQTFDSKLAEAYKGSQTLAAGVNQVVPGSEQLKSGLTQVESGVAKLADGAGQLNEGTHKLADGTQAVAAGTNELSGKLKEAAQQTSAIHGGDALYKAFSQPVAFEQERLNEVPNYGTGFSPYFLSLGLFVGALVLTVVFSVKEPAIAPKSGTSWFFGKLGTMLLVGFLQAVAMASVIKWGLGLEVQSLGLFFLFSILTSWTYMILIQMLVSMFGDPGRFAAIVLLILQLTTSAGTFPVELIPGPLQSLNAWLPMTYTVQGYKAAISSGVWSDFWYNSAILGVFIVLMASVTLVYFVAQFRRHGAEVAEKAGKVIVA